MPRGKSRVRKLGLERPSLFVLWLLGMEIAGVEGG